MSTLKDYVALGMDLGAIQYAHEVHPVHVQGAITTLEDSLARHGLTSSAVALGGLKAWKSELTSLAKTRPSAMLRSPQLLYLHQQASSVVEVVLAEAAAVQLRIAKIHMVSDRIRDLNSTIPLTAIQKALQAELTSVIEIQAWRAAAVLAWNLFFDIVRHSLFSSPEQMTIFNAFIDPPDGKSRHDAIKDYSDFFAIPERTLLDWMRIAGLLPEKRCRSLVEWLDYRNDLAHVNFRNADGDAVRGKIHELLDTVLEVIR